MVKLQVKGRKELITIVGNLISANPGETLRLKREWIQNKIFGSNLR
jgi:hypothetical protein